MTCLQTLFFLSLSGDSDYLEMVWPIGGMRPPAGTTVAPWIKADAAPGILGSADH